MNPRTVIKLLAAVCAGELIVIAGLLATKTATPVESVPVAGPVAVDPAQKTPPRTAGPGQPTGSAAPQPGLAQQKAALETELAAVKKELTERKSEIAFSYGSTRDSGRFVGMTFRKMFETAAARETKEAQERMADNQINVLSLGPFIQDADVIESDPTSFAQFQGALVSQVLGLPTQRQGEVEALLADLKTKSLKTEIGSPEWGELNDTALKGITALLSDEEQQAMKGQIDFFRQYGVLVIPAYAILRAPTPTIASPPAPDPGGTK